VFTRAHNFPFPDSDEFSSQNFILFLWVPF
jgi:hypothetical protein